ncbi:MAG TPA: carbohydrate ABC transporter permease [Fimbriimonadaceae bacterium]|nr:carbohydrate ABC transporter permease [Fimbriimonadaceae bacterium]
MSMLSKGLSYLLLLGLAAFLVAPFVWMVLISLHPSKTPIPPLNEILPYARKEIKDADGKALMEMDKDGKPVPKTEAYFAPRFDNYSFVLFHPNLPVARFFLNSVFVTVMVVLGQLLVASMAAYGFSRLRFRGRDWVFALFLGSMMFAGPVTQIPVYLLLRNLGWLDTYWSLIIPGVSSAFSIFLLRQFFMQIPKELDEAARMDGAGDFLIYWRVILPLSRAALATCAAFTFIGVWTDFFGPLIYTNTTEMRTLEVGLSIFKNSYGGQNWPLQMTAAVIVMLPLLVVFLFTQKYFIKGITIGSIK